MKPTETPLSTPSYTGHVKNGVIILDAQVPLQDGQAVRVEPLAPSAGLPISSEQLDRVRQLQQLFAEWTAEDAQLSDEDADQLQSALEQGDRLHFRSAKLD